MPDPFITEIVQIWTEMSFEDTVKSIEHLLSLNLWHNSLVKVGKKPIYYKSWSTKGIQKVRHLMRDESKFLSFTEFKERFQLISKRTFSPFMVFNIYKKTCEIILKRSPLQKETLNALLMSF